MSVIEHLNTALLLYGKNCTAHTGISEHFIHDELKCNLRMSWICGQQVSGGMTTTALVWAFDHLWHSFTPAEQALTTAADDIPGKWRLAGNSPRLHKIIQIHIYNHDNHDIIILTHTYAPV